MATEPRHGRDDSEVPLAAYVAVGVGGVLALIGVVAPVVAGPEGELLVFGRNYLHDAVHLATGLAGLAAGYYAGGRYAEEYALGLGVVYLLVSVAGILFLPTLSDLLALNVADNALHVLLAVVLLGTGIVFRGL